MGEETLYAGDCEGRLMNITTACADLMSLGQTSHGAPDSLGGVNKTTLQSHVAKQ